MTTRNIHPTACISDNAELGKNVVVGPYAIVESDVFIGEGSCIDAHAVIKSYVRLGKNNHVHTHAVLGDLPQDIGFNTQLKTWMEAGDDNVFREHVTVNRATREGKSTRLGSACYLMCNSHIGHDVSLGDAVIVGPSVGIGGHCAVGDRVFFGGGAMVHQHCRIGSLAMIAGVIGVRKDVMPFMLIGGEPVRHYRLNIVGLRRAGVTGDRLNALTRAYRLLRNKDDLHGAPDTQEVHYLHNWLSVKSNRGIYGFVEAQHSILED